MKTASYNRRTLFSSLGILSKLLIKVPVVIFGEVVKPTLKQADNSIGGMSGNTHSTQCRAALGRRFGEPLGRLLTIYHGQLNSLSVFKSHFGERLNTPFS